MIGKVTPKLNIAIMFVMLATLILAACEGSLVVGKTYEVRKNGAVLGVVTVTSIAEDSAAISLDGAESVTKSIGEPIILGGIQFELVGVVMGSPGSATFSSQDKTVSIVAVNTSPQEIQAASEPDVPQPDLEPEHQEPNPAPGPGQEAMKVKTCPVKWGAGKNEPPTWEHAADKVFENCGVRVTVPALQKANERILLKRGEVIELTIPSEIAVSVDQAVEAAGEVAEWILYGNQTRQIAEACSWGTYTQLADGTVIDWCKEFLSLNRNTIYVLPGSGSVQLVNGANAAEAVVGIMSSGDVLLQGSLLAAGHGLQSVAQVKLQNDWNTDTWSLAEEIPTVSGDEFPLPEGWQEKVHGLPDPSHTFQGGLLKGMSRIKSYEAIGFQRPPNGRCFKRPPGQFLDSGLEMNEGVLLEYIFAAPFSGSGHRYKVVQFVYNLVSPHRSTVMPVPMGNGKVKLPRGFIQDLGGVGHPECAEAYQYLQELIQAVKQVLGINDNWPGFPLAP